MDVQMLIATDWEGWASDAVFRANRFYVEGTARYGHPGEPQPDYAGRHIDKPADASGREETLAGAPGVDWNAPEFDPAKPAGFDDFLARHRKWMIRLFEQQFGAPLKLGP